MNAAQDLLKQALLLPVQERYDLATVLLRDVVAQDLLKEIWKLPSEERGDLARQLLQSLESSTLQADYDSAWEREIVERLQRFDEGLSQAVDWREAHAEIRNKLRGKLP